MITALKLFSIIYTFDSKRKSGKGRQGIVRKTLLGENFIPVFRSYTNGVYMCIRLFQDDLHLYVDIYTWAKTKRVYLIPVHASPTSMYMYMVFIS